MVSLRQKGSFLTTNVWFPYDKLVVCYKRQEVELFDMIRPFFGHKLIKTSHNLFVMWKCLYICARKTNSFLK
jgi:hypothetical protein